MGHYESIQLRAAVLILKLAESSAGASQRRNADGGARRTTQT